nr:sialate O-acetylesterase [uncultured Marinifilum sp.]
MKKTTSLLVLIMCVLVAFAQKDFTVSPLFSENMILQWGKEFRINGRGTKGDKIEIQIKTKNQIISRYAKVNRKGEWFADFPALAANCKCTIQISGGGKTIEIKGIKTGDVWLIVGGSNTVHKLGNADLFEEEIAKVDSDQFKYLVIPKGSALMPQSMPEDVKWKNHNNVNLPQIPDIAYYMGTGLSSNVDLPIGIINCGYGGSLIESWMSATDLGYSYESLAQKNQQIKKEFSAAKIQSFQNRFPYSIKIDSINCDRSVIASPDFDDSNWQYTRVPETFKYKGLEDFDGLVWFRKKVEVPNGVLINKINIGYVDDSDEVYINGHFIGGIEDGYGVPRSYNIPEHVMKAGMNTIAVRVRDIGGGGGLYGDKAQYNLSGNGITIDISGKWKYRVETLESDVAMNDIRREGMLYNQMIHPLTKFPVKGIVWYQGEVEALGKADLGEYTNKLKQLVQGYRREFKNDELPFVIVQLASYGHKDNPELNSWVNFKYAQDQFAREMPDTEIVSITDLMNEKDPLNIHLSNHQVTGERIVNTALLKCYRSNSGAICPKITQCEVESDFIILHVENDQNLMVADEYAYIKGFEIAGSEKQFVKVPAKLLPNNRIVIRMGDTKAVYLRYCGHANALEGNLYNQKGMPLMPFFTKIKR